MTHKMMTFTRWIMLVGTLAACSTEPPAVPGAVSLSATSLTFSALGEAQQLSSSVTDQAGNQLDDASVSWSTSNAAVATVTEIGLVRAVGPGLAEIRATAGPVNAVAQVTVVQIPAQIQKVSGDGQTVSGGQPLPAPLVLRVNDSRGNPIPGVQVTLTVSQGEGSVNNSSVTTGADGTASTTFITGTDTGSPQEVSAVVQSTTTSVSFTATVPSDPTAFNIGIRFLGAPTPSQRQAFADARLRWERVITQDLEDFLLNAPAPACEDSNTPSVSKEVDDLLILVDLLPIDGPDGTVAQAGPCYVRNYGAAEIEPGDLPILGLMQFDAEDLEILEADGVLAKVIIHEMGHVLGFGSLWPFQGLLADPYFPIDTLNPNLDADPHFTGPQARGAFDNIGGTAYVGAKVPVQNTGGPGNVDSHWRDAVFGNELMTGFIEPGSSPLSIVTLASLGDQGYSVDLSQADPYNLLLSSLRAFDTRPRLRLGNDVLRMPIRMVDASGRTTGELRQ